MAKCQECEKEVSVTKKCDKCGYELCDFCFGNDSNSCYVCEMYGEEWQECEKC